MAKKTSGIAIASMVLGIFSIIFGWIPVFGWAVILTGLIFGIWSLLTIQKDKDSSGKGFAITGIILSSISLIIVVLLIVCTFTLFNDIRNNWTKEDSPSGDIYYNMDQDIRVDYRTYRITKAETFTEMGISPMKKITNEKFIKIYFQITNNANETNQIFSNRLKLIDSKNRKFDSLPGGSMYITDCLEWGMQIQPSLSVSGAVVFEIPKDSEDLKLEIMGGMFSLSKAIVNLSDIHDTGKDTSLQDIPDKVMDGRDALPNDMGDGGTVVTTNEIELTTCEEPFKCVPSCRGANLGQMDCPSGKTCCWIN